jgi:hypothetical protein
MKNVNLFHANINITKSKEGKSAPKKLLIYTTISWDEDKVSHATYRVIWNDRRKIPKTNYIQIKD